MNIKTNSKPRAYRKTTKAEVQRFNIARLEQGNGTAAVREISPGLSSPKDKAYKLAKKSEQMNATDYIDESLQHLAAPAMKRIGDMINSSDERIATRNAHFVVDHVRGKALQRSESKHMSLNIQTVLE